ncbi:cytochrome c oxidase assembly protein subunit 11 [Rhizobiales bacterium GAS191]|nr:cytochrome c oxidase assembly protein subunit 11 [Rhizobiales bacterium GAS191]
MGGDTPSPNRQAPVSRGSRRTAVVAALVPALMLGASFAAVPAYRIFCQATGFAGTPLIATQAPTHSLGQMMVVRFDANVAPGLAWNFAPEAPFVHLRLGETKTVEFRVTNDSDRPAAAVAAFNIQPDLAAQYFNKLSCFCFDETVLKPHETRDLPVVFFVDPALAKDKDIRSLTSLTLSYTFFASKTGKSQMTTPQAATTSETRVN